MKTRGVDELRAQRTDECHTCLITMIAQLLFTKSSFLNERVCAYACAQRFASITIPILMYIVFPYHSTL